ncbi:hypothetical protein EGR_07375 [Echinococcus granulosus]|uniref:Uncharacterized protein n=1 Tax=Echinococcus granulosus TaxID=6210 RepID=W6UI78_ECHGR|nr:hypothetical protein EGR_07375 [Echinococcus granulosus]EUB57807.1 hypothetical protein EGR_07375 [Echinococcus granulosus]
MTEVLHALRYSESPLRLDCPGFFKAKAGSMMRWM